MRIRWRGLELPSRVVRDESISTATYGRFIVEPFERGFGTTVGNSLRRILLSSLEGSAVTHARIGGADHEFCSLPGVLEDVTDIILNIKSIIVDLDGENPERIRLERRGRGEVRAGDLECPPQVTVYNREQLIATLTDDVTFSLELTVARGRGYVPASEHTQEDAELGLIAVDALYSPVTRVRYRIEDTRVGQKTNYDRLILEIWTKGTVRPEDALVEAAKILRKHLNPFVQYYDMGHEMAVGGSHADPAGNPLLNEELRHKLEMPISQMNLSSRAGNCLEAAKIVSVGDLVRYDEASLLQLRSFGKTSLMEVKRRLSDMGLSLGMNLGTAAERPAAGSPGSVPSEN